MKKTSISEERTTEHENSSCSSYTDSKSSMVHNITNFYIPTLQPKKYNPLKLRELVQNTLLQKENRNYRKLLNIPYRNHPQKALSKQPLYPSFKPQSTTPHPTFTTVQLRNRRTNQFFYCKKSWSKQSNSAFLTQGLQSKRFEQITE